MSSLIDAFERASAKPAAPPVSTNRGASSTPPLAPIKGRSKGKAQGGISTNQAVGAPPSSTNQGAPAELCALLPSPAPQDIKATRLAAGHTQSQAAAAIGFTRWQTWSDYEGGHQVMPPLQWTWYLLTTGAHPKAVMRKRPKPRP